jgi:hypothetical protein
MKVFIKILVVALLFCCPTWATTYYVCADTGSPCNASDSNAGTSKTATWLHAPGMTNCTGVCASTAINPGDSIIFRGGDTWHFGNSGSSPYSGGGWTFSHSGSSGSPIYIGVDLTWFSGGSWARPVMNGDNPLSTSFPASCAFNESSIDFLILHGSFITVDNFEWTGRCWNNGGSSAYIFSNSSSNANLVLSNLYFHGWTAILGGVDSQSYLGSGTAQTNNIWDHNVVDGSDSSQGAANSASCASSYQPTMPCVSGGGIYQEMPIIRYSVFRYAEDFAVVTNLQSAHDNLFEFLYDTYQSNGQHSNVINNNFNPGYSAQYFYNNIVRHTFSTQTLYFTFSGSSSLYFFNNVFYDNMRYNSSSTAPTNCIQLEVQSGGTQHFNFYNNTLDQDADDATGGGCQITFWGTPFDPAAFTGTFTAENNHLIGSANLASIYTIKDAGVTLTVTDNGGEVFGVTSTARSQGYTQANNDAPPATGCTSSSNCQTYLAANNVSGSCSTFSSDSALCSSTSMGVSELSGSGGEIASSPAIPVHSRPSVWDAGAYLFAQLTVTITVVGPGVSVSDSLGGIVNCTSLTSPCVGTYSGGSDTLTATATNQHQLLSWGGACASQYPTCTLAVTSNLSVTANAGGCGPPTYPCTSTSTAAVGTLNPAFSALRPFNSTTFFTPLNPNADCLTRFIDQNIVQYGTSASGTVNTSGTVVTFVSGNNFVNTWGNSNITINGVVYQIAGSPIPTTNTLTLTTSAGTQNGVAYSFAGVSLATPIGQANLTTGGGDTNQMSSINAAYLAIVANGVNWIFQTNTQGSCIQNNTNGGENPSVGMAGPFGFSRLTDTVFYWVSANHILNQGMLNSSAIPMTFTTTNNANFPFDFDNCPAASTGAGSSSTFLGISSDDSTFGLGIVWGGGGQGTGHLLFVYKLGVGCSALDVSPAGTSTTAANWYAFCSGNCSPAGTNVPPSGTSTVCFDPNAATGSGIHDAQLSLSGNVLESAGACFTPLGVGNVAMWQAGTGNILGVGQSGSTWDGVSHYSGHNTFGFAAALITNPPNPNFRVVDPLTTTNLGGYVFITPIPASLGAGASDYHGDWPEPLGQPHDINYWIIGSHNATAPTTPVYLENMVFGLSPTAGTLPIPVFGPEFATGSSPYFGCGNSILYASQNAKWAVFITDDLNNLGTDANGNPLCSVYVYALDGPAAPPHPPCVSCFLADNSQPAKVESVVKGDRK